MENLTSTILHSLLDLNQVRVMEGLSNELLTAMTAPMPIRELV